MGAEHVDNGAKEPESKKRKRQQLDIDENGNNIVEQLRKMQQKLTKLGAEVGSIKTEKQLLLEKNNTFVAKLAEMQANSRELHARLGTMEQKLEAAELKAQLANQQMQNSFADKLTAMSDQLWEELCKTLKEKSEGQQRQQGNALTSNLGESRKMWSLVNDVLHENQQKISAQEAKMEDMDKKMEAELVKMAKHLDPGEMAKLGGKLAVLESQVVDGQNKLEQTRKTMLDGLKLIRKKFDEKFTAVSDQLGKELCKTLEEKSEELMKRQGNALTSKMEEENSKLCSFVQSVRSKLLHENQQKFNEHEAKMADISKKMKVDLVKMAKQLDQGIAELGGKLTALECQAVDGQNKLEQTRKTLLDGLNLSIWHNNRWHISDQERASTTDGLVVKKSLKGYVFVNVRAAQPISHAIFALIPGLKLIYWEVQVNKFCVNRIGWIGAANFSLNDDWIGNCAGSAGINCCGALWESGREGKGYGNAFCAGDVVGTGFTRDGKLFFTKNGRLNGKPIVFDAHANLLLHPAICLQSNAEAEANFGADPEKKPFKFDFNAHEAQLFD